MMDPRAIRLWNAQMRAWRLYFRYSVEGLEHLDGERSAVVVGYHGRVVAWDLLMLHEVLYRRHGRMHFGVFHSLFERNPITRWMLDGLEWTTRDGPELEQAVRDGRHLILAPGGDREATRAASEDATVDWGHRTGYLRLAIDYGLDVVPVAAGGVDSTYFGLNDGFRWGRKFALPNRLPAWIGVGPLGFYPYSPPYPAKIHQIIGAPLSLEDLGLDRDSSRARLAEASRFVQDRVQALLDRAEAVRNHTQWRLRRWKPGDAR